MSSSIRLALRSALAGVAILLGAACGHFGFGGPDTGDALAIFSNESLDQADVYAVAPGSDFVRIGTVFPGRTDTLRIPSSLVANGSGVNVVARLLARSITPSSGNVMIRPGDVYSFRLPPDSRSILALPAR